MTRFDLIETIECFWGHGVRWGQLDQWLPELVQLDPAFPGVFFLFNQTIMELGFIDGVDPRI